MRRWKPQVSENCGLKKVPTISNWPLDGDCFLSNRSEPQLRHTIQWSLKLFDWKQRLKATTFQNKQTMCSCWSSGLGAFVSLCEFGGCLFAYWQLAGDEWREFTGSRCWMPLYILFDSSNALLSLSNENPDASSHSNGVTVWGLPEDQLRCFLMVC